MTASPRAESDLVLLDGVRNVAGRNTRNVQKMSFDSTETLASSPSAALVDLDLSTISAVDGADFLVSPFDKTPEEESRPYRDLVTTRVFTVQRHEGTPLRLAKPCRPSTGQPHSPRARFSNGHRARSACIYRPCDSRDRKKRRICTPAGQVPGVVRAAGGTPTTRTQARYALNRRTSNSSGPLCSMNTNGIHIAFPGVHGDSKSRPTHHPQHQAQGLRSLRLRRYEQRIPVAAAVQARMMHIWGNVDSLPSPRRPRTLSAPARNLAIRRVVDKNCSNLPAAPRDTFGACRFLQQWDTASRSQRRCILEALAGQLLQPRNVNTICNMRVQGREQNRVDDQPCFGPRARVRGVTNCAEGRGDSIRRHPGDVLDAAHSSQDLQFCSFISEVDNLFRNGRTSSTNGESGTLAHENAQEWVRLNRTTMVQSNHSRVTSSLDVRSVNPSFLELMGAHAGLLAMRISSNLKLSHAWGRRTLGSCLRVATLLTESTTLTSGCKDGNSNGIGSDTSCLLHPFYTSELICAVLEVVALGDTIGGNRRRPSTPSSTATGEALSASRGPALDKDDVNRAEALRFLLALVRAEGKDIKESLTRPCSSTPFEEGMDALGPTMRALRRPGCTAGTRTAAGALLVELGVDNPAGFGKVWGVILSLLERNESFDDQSLGCCLAQRLLARSSYFERCDGEHPGDLGRICLSTQEEPLSMDAQPESTVVPLVLDLMLSISSDVRDAAGQLAIFLSMFSDSCCQVVVGSIVDIFWVIVEMDGDTPLNACPERSLPYRSREWGYRRDSTWVSAATVEDGNADLDINENMKHNDNTTDIGAVRAIELLRQICASIRGNQDAICSILSSTLAPLAVFQLVIGSGTSTTELPRGPSKAVSVATAAPDKTFVTQGRSVNIDEGGSSIAAVSPARGPQDRNRESRGERLDDDDDRHDTNSIRNLSETRHESTSPRHLAFRCVDVDSAAPHPTQLCHAVAELLIAMYRMAKWSPCQEGNQAPEQSWIALAEPDHVNEFDKGTLSPLLPCNAQSGSPLTRGRGIRNRPVSATSDLKGMIDAALADSPTLSRSLRNADVLSLAYVFGTTATAHGGEVHPDIVTLRRNVEALIVRSKRTVSPLLVGKKHALHSGDPLRSIVSKNEGTKDANTGYKAPLPVRKSHDGAGGSLAFSEEAEKESGLPQSLIAARARYGGGHRALRSPEGVDVNLATGATAGFLGAVFTRPTCTTKLYGDKCGHKRRRSGARIPVVTIMGWVTTAAAKATVVGPRAPVSSVDTGALKVWGPTDWEAEEAPTMAMLTTEASRQTKVPERKEGERPGPMWRTIFGGGYGLPASFTEVKSTASPKDAAGCGSTSIGADDGDAVQTGIAFKATGSLPGGRSAAVGCGNGGKVGGHRGEGHTGEETDGDGRGAGCDSPTNYISTATPTVDGNECEGRPASAIRTLNSAKRRTGALTRRAEESNNQRKMKDFSPPLRVTHGRISARTSSVLPSSSVHRMVATAAKTKATTVSASTETRSDTRCRSRGSATWGGGRKRARRGRRAVLTGRRRELHTSISRTVSPLMQLLTSLSLQSGRKDVGCETKSEQSFDVRNGGDKRSHDRGARHPFSLHPQCPAVRSKKGEGSAWIWRQLAQDRGVTLSALRSSKIAKGGFELAERYPTMAVARGGAA